MKKEVTLPKDELPHKDQAIEWWYFNGFLEGKKHYAFMTSLFKADKEKSNLHFLHIPLKTIYFSHTMLFDLTTRKIRREILPLVVISEDSFSKESLFVNYFYPIRKKFINYEINRINEDIRLKTYFFDILLTEKKKPLFEGGTGFLNLGNKSTYYYSYTNLAAKGTIGDDYVKGKVWYDKQWASKGFMQDYWLWFSLQFQDNTEIVCFEYKNKTFASISYKNNKQEHCTAFFKPIGKLWKSNLTGIMYNLNWEIHIKDMKISIAPLFQNCEMNFGDIHYWEGPIIAKLANGLKAQGFMEILPEKKSKSSFIKSFFKEEENLLSEIIKPYFS